MDRRTRGRRSSEIRRIYFATTRQTIEHDLAHAIELLKSLPGEEEREKASVYMEGLNQMRREWDARPPRKPQRGRDRGDRPRRPAGESPSITGSLLRDDLPPRRGAQRHRARCDRSRSP